MQNKCIRFCLRLDKMHHISEEEVKLINWLPTSKSVDHCINAVTYNFVNNTCPYYLNENFEFAPHCRMGTRNSFSKLKNPFSKTNMEQKTISYIGASIWNSLADSIKNANSLNTFKHKALSDLNNTQCLHVNMCICIYICLYIRECVYMYIWLYVSVFSFDLSILMFFFSVTLFSHFSSNSRDHNENKAFLLVLCYSDHC